MKGFLTSILVAVLFLFSCSKDNPVVSPPNDQNPFPQNPSLSIKVDARLELLAVIQHFTDWAAQRHTKFNFQYKNEIDSYFKNFSGHAAVTLSQSLTNSGFSYDAPPTFVLYHSDPPEFKQLYPYSSYLIQRAGGEEKLKEFADQIRSFASASNFMDFYNSHKQFYTDIENSIKGTIGDTDYVKILENYYGVKKAGYNITPVPLFHSGGYGPQISTADGDQVFDLCGPQSVVNNKPTFGTKDYLLYIVLHEFSHSFVNPITEKFSSDIAKSASLFLPIKDKMQQQAYGTWQTCVNEHLVRANTARFAVQIRGKSYHDMYLQSEINNGFIYITKLDSLLQIYESKRDVYKTYEDFYPEFIKLFNTLAQK